MSKQHFSILSLIGGGFAALYLSLELGHAAGMLEASLGARTLVFMGGLFLTMAIWSKLAPNPKLGALTTEGMAHDDRARLRWARLMIGAGPLLLAVLGMVVQGRAFADIWSPQMLLVVLILFGPILIAYRRPAGRWMI